MHTQVCETYVIAKSYNLDRKIAQICNKVTVIYFDNIEIKHGRAYSRQFNFAHL